MPQKILMHPAYRQEFHAYTGKPWRRPTKLFKREAGRQVPVVEVDKLEYNHQHRYQGRNNPGSIEEFGNSKNHHHDSEYTRLQNHWQPFSSSSSLRSAR